MGRTIIIGDVHGCLQELRELLIKIEHQSEDRVIMLGDLINRGPDSAGVVGFVRSAGFECLLGNHEYDYLARFGSEKKYINLFDQIGREAHDWIAALPLFIESENFIAVHAGLEPGKHPSQSAPQLLVNIRTWDETNGRIGGIDQKPWYDYYIEERPVFYGHWARQGLNERKNTIGLDSGCVYGRELSAYILDERRVIQVSAHRSYFSPVKF